MYGSDYNFGVSFVIVKSNFYCKVLFLWYNLCILAFLQVLIYHNKFKFICLINILWNIICIQNLNTYVFANCEW